MTDETSFAGFLAHLVSEKETVTERIKRMVCEKTGLSPEEATVEADPFGNINVTCKPKTAMKTVEVVLEPRGGGEQ